MHFYLELFTNTISAIILCYIIYIFVYHDPKTVRMGSLKKVIGAYNEGKLNKGDTVIINNEMCGNWVNFVNEDKTICKVRISENLVVDVLSESISLLPSKM